MKKLLSLVLVLVMVSALVGCGQQEPRLKGSYSTEGSALGYNLVFDEQGHFCLYTQEDGLLAEGNYRQRDGHLYDLSSITGECSSVILEEDGVYYIAQRPAWESAASYRIDFFQKYSEVPTFTGSWAQDWGHFPEGAYEIAVP